MTSIENQNIIVERNRLQDLAAWRSTLPLALSKLMSISCDGMAAAVRSGSAATWTQSDLNERLEVPTAVMDTLRNCIKSSDDESRKWLSVLVSRYQVYRSRSEELLTHGAGSHDLALDWATFYALVEHCYPFARGATDQIGITMDSQRINSAFFLNDIELDDDADFAKLVRIKLERYGIAPVSTFQFSER